MSRKGGPAADAKDKKAKGRKGAKGAKAPAAARPRRGMVQNHYVALAGLGGLAVIAVLMLRGQLDLVAAGQRAAAVFGAVLVVERVVLPVCRALVGPPGAGRPSA